MKATAALICPPCNRCDKMRDELKRVERKCQQLEDALTMERRIRVAEIQREAQRRERAQ